MGVLLRAENICKSFMENQVLKDVTIQVHSGECLALVGENGAGKSTLMKILTGIYKLDSGRILLRGREEAVNSPSQAQELGIAIIHQELNLIPNLTVAQNIFLGRERKRGPAIDDAALSREAGQLCQRLGIILEPGETVGALSVAKQQIVEIVRALSQNAEIIIMDEPTAALNLEETQKLFAIIDELRKAGKGIIYISHRLEEIYRVAQRICVLRDGRLSGSFSAKDAPVGKVVESMVGQSIEKFYPKREHEMGETIFRVKNLSDNRNFYDVTFEVREGEILGIAGLMGAGQVPLARCIYGLNRQESGHIYLEGKELRYRRPSTSILRGLGLVTENRKEEGLILPMTVRENVGLSPWAPVTFAYGIFSRKKETRLAAESIRSYHIKAESQNQETVLLSGGNQQKVVLAKVLATGPKVVILCEPTRGVDVQGKVEIYNIINQLLAGKKAVILISSEIPEILGMSDRVAVIYKGRIVYEQKNKGLKQEDLMVYATGGFQNGQ